MSNEDEFDPDDLYTKFGYNKPPTEAPSQPWKMNEWEALVEDLYTDATGFSVGRMDWIAVDDGGISAIYEFNSDTNNHWLVVRKSAAYEGEAEFRLLSIKQESAPHWFVSEGKAPTECDPKETIQTILNETGTDVASGQSQTVEDFVDAMRGLFA